MDSADTSNKVVCVCGGARTRWSSIAGDMASLRFNNLRIVMQIAMRSTEHSVQVRPTAVVRHFVSLAFKPNALVMFVVTDDVCGEGLVIER